jgi:tetratricopeptide (TPR) repeat protein
VAAYVWTAPLRAERALKTASLSQLQAAARHEPGNPRPCYYLGLRLLELGQPTPAEQAFRRAADLDSDDAKSWLGAATAAAARGDIQEGLGIAIAFVRRHPDNADGHFTIAQLCVVQGSFQHAYEEALTATRLDPHDADAWRLAGEAALARGQQPEAEQALRRAIAQSPRDWRSELDLGNLLIRRGPSEEGTACLETATRLAPTEALPSLRLGAQRLRQAVTPAQIEAARQTLLQSAQLQANNAEVNHQLGISEIRLGHPQAARDYLERAQNCAPADLSIVSDLIVVDRLLHATPALEQETDRRQKLLAYQNQQRRLLDKVKADPGDPQPLWKLARLCAQSGNRLQADRYYRLLLARVPDQKAIRQEWEAVQSRAAGESPLPVTSPEPTVVSADATPVRLLLRDADALLAQGHQDQAQSAYLSLLARDPRVAEACVGLARVMDAGGHREQALAYWEKAVALDPRLWQAQFALAARYGGDNLYTEAAQHYRQGLAVAPRNAQGWHALGALLAHVTDWYQEAEDALGRAVTLQPDQAVFLRDLADLEAKRHELDRAESHFRRALALAPQDAGMQREFAAFLIANRPAVVSLREAGRLLEAAAASAPGNAMTGYWRGRLALQQGEARRAIGWLLRAAPGVHRMDAIHLWYSLSRAYQMAGDQKRAAAALAAADRARTCDLRITTTENRLSDDPRNGTLNLQLARLYVEGGEIAAAIQQYRRIERLGLDTEAARAERTKLEALRKTPGTMPAL